MSWMNDSNGFSEDDLKSLFDLRPGIDCDIQTISWRKFADVSTVSNSRSSELIASH